MTSGESVPGSATTECFIVAKGEEVVFRGQRANAFAPPWIFLGGDGHSDGMGWFPQLMSADPV